MFALLIYGFDWLLTKKKRIVRIKNKIISLYKFIPNTKLIPYKIGFYISKILSHGGWGGGSPPPKLEKKKIKKLDVKAPRIKTIWFLLFCEVGLKSASNYSNNNKYTMIG